MNLSLKLEITPEPSTNSAGDTPRCDWRKSVGCRAMLRCDDYVVGS